MPVAGKTKHDWCAKTLCDFGTPGRRDTLARHFSLAAAVRAFKRINKIYGELHGWNCWQEDRNTTVIQGERPPSSAL